MQLSALLIHISAANATRSMFTTQWHLCSLAWLSHSPFRHLHSLIWLPHSPFRHLHSLIQLSLTPFRHFHSLTQLSHNPFWRLCSLTQLLTLLVHIAAKSMVTVSAFHLTYVPSAVVRLHSVILGANLVLTRNITPLLPLCYPLLYMTIPLPAPHLFLIPIVFITLA